MTLDDLELLFAWFRDFGRQRWLCE